MTSIRRFSIGSSRPNVSPRLLERVQGRRRARGRLHRPRRTVSIAGVTDSRMRSSGTSAPARTRSTSSTTASPTATPTRSASGARASATSTRCSARSALAVAPDDHVLDLGCGIGRLTRVARRARRARHRARRLAARCSRAPQELNAGLDNVDVGARRRRDARRASPTAPSTRVVSPRRAPAHPEREGPARLRRGVRPRPASPGGWAAFGLSTDPRVHEPRAPASRRDLFRAIAGQTPGGQDEPEWLGAAVPLDALGADRAARPGLDARADRGREHAVHARARASEEAAAPEVGGHRRRASTTMTPRITQNAALDALAGEVRRSCRRSRR